MKIFYKILTILFAVSFLGSCTYYSTDLNEMEKIQISAMDDIQKGKACSHNIFGGFKLPYFGDTAIRFRGNESVITAIQDANINRIYAVDLLTNNYILYSRRCTIVFGKLELMPKTQ